MHCKRCIDAKIIGVYVMSKAFVHVRELFVVSFIAVLLRLDGAALVDARDVAAVSRTAAVARARYDTYAHDAYTFVSHVVELAYVAHSFSVVVFRVVEERQRH